jgi:hypothetical protein
MQELVILIMTWAAVAVVLLVLITVFVSEYLFDRMEQQWNRSWFLKFTAKKKSTHD